eukprot:617988-Rhodomonas_salina.1
MCIRDRLSGHCGAGCCRVRGLGLLGALALRSGARARRRGAASASHAHSAGGGGLGGASVCRRREGRREEARGTAQTAGGRHGSTLLLLASDPQAGLP